MNYVIDHPLLVFVLSSLVLSLSAGIGAFLSRRRNREGIARNDFGVIQAATLTPLGFSFSMATSRYDLRKSYEEAEANAIGTEIVRADLLPVTDAAKVRALLTRYLAQRILFYRARDAQELERINAETAQLQADLWSAVRVPASAQPTPVVALAVSGMNDVLNSEGYTQAEWWNRIPIAAWELMSLIAICCNVLVGYGARKLKGEAVMLLILPMIVAISFTLIADIDSPRGGSIRVNPRNLVSLAESLRVH